MQMAGPEACQHVEGPGEGRRGGASAAEEQKGGVEEDRSANINQGTTELRVHIHFQKGGKKKGHDKHWREAGVEKPEHLLMLVGM